MQNSSTNQCPEENSNKINPAEYAGFSSANSTNTLIFAVDLIRKIGYSDPIRSEEKSMIVYLHGFNSTGTDSGKFTDLKQGLPEIDVYAPTYPSNDPDEAIRIVSDLVNEHKDDYDELMFVGTSMGGYFAQYLGREFNGKVVLINPATEITTTLKTYLGKNINFYTGEEYYLSEDNVAAFGKYDVVPNYKHECGTLVLLDESDELIDYKVAYNKYKEVAECHVFEGGDHRFAHMEQALPLIERYYNSVWS